VVRSGVGVILQGERSNGYTPVVRTRKLQWLGLAAHSGIKQKDLIKFTGSLPQTSAIQLFYG
jgi:hypothetical protein